MDNLLIVIEFLAGGTILNARNMEVLSFLAGAPSQLADLEGEQQWINIICCINSSLRSKMFKGT